MEHAKRRIVDRQENTERGNRKCGSFLGSYLVKTNQLSKCQILHKYHFSEILSQGWVSPGKTTSIHHSSNIKFIKHHFPGMDFPLGKLIMTSHTLLPRDGFPPGKAIVQLLTPSFPEVGFQLGKLHNYFNN